MVKLCLLVIPVSGYKNHHNSRYKNHHTVNIVNIGTPEIINYPKISTRWFKHTAMQPKDVEGMENSADPDQTAYRSIPVISPP